MKAEAYQDIKVITFRKDMENKLILKITKFKKIIRFAENSD